MSRRELRGGPLNGLVLEVQDYVTQVRHPVFLPDWHPNPSTIGYAVYIPAGARFMVYRGAV